MKVKNITAKVLMWLSGSIMAFGMMLGLRPSGSLAAITWDFAGVTGELAGLGTALVTAGGLAIAGALVLFGIKRAVTFVLGLFTKTASK
ncbi:MAG: hypothetical protein JWM32_1201 [Verrucomicrobia bacterium]|nr:hypothetical protein [Verrucomicrobiota bacterium]